MSFTLEVKSDSAFPKFRLGFHKVFLRGLEAICKAAGATVTAEQWHTNYIVVLKG